MYSSGRRNDGILREGYLDKVKWSKVNKIVSSGKMKVRIMIRFSIFGDSLRGS